MDKQFLRVSRAALASVILFAAQMPMAGSAKPPIVGATLDAHGCRPSAGYTFSTLRKDCIRLFETGIRLTPVAKGLAKSLSAFVVFKTENGEGNAELFLPNNKASISMKIVKGDNAGIWNAPGLRLTQWKGMYILENNKGKSLYQGSVA